jgi:hypothetical protein
LKHLELVLDVEYIQDGERALYHTSCYARTQRTYEWHSDVEALTLRRTFNTGAWALLLSRFRALKSLTYVIRPRSRGRYNYLKAFFLRILPRVSRELEKLVLRVDFNLDTITSYGIVSCSAWPANLHLLHNLKTLEISGAIYLRPRRLRITDPTFEGMSGLKQELTPAADLFPPKIETWRFTPDRLALGDVQVPYTQSVDP